MLNEMYFGHILLFNLVYYYHMHRDEELKGGGGGLAISVDFGELKHDLRARPVLLSAIGCVLCWLFIVACISAGPSLLLTSCAWLSMFSIFTLLAALTAIVVKKRDPTHR